MKKKMFSIALWGTIFLAALVGVDRFLVTTPVKLPLLADVQSFYLDFRGRLASLVGLGSDAIGEVIEPPKSKLEASKDAVKQATQKVVNKVTGTVSSVTETVSKQDELKYLYVDDQGQLNFTSSFSDIPEKFKESAELLKD